MYYARFWVVLRVIMALIVVLLVLRHTPLYVYTRSLRALFR